MLPMDLGPIYRLGQVTLTPTARATLSDADLAPALLRHVRKAWGQGESIRRKQSCRTPLEGCRLLSAYRAANGVPFWIISEADKSLTTVLLPEECHPLISVRRSLRSA